MKIIKAGDMRCSNCAYYNGEKGDEYQFCDDKETDVHEDGYCYRWQEKHIEREKNRW